MKKYIATISFYPERIQNRSEPNVKAVTTELEQWAESPRNARALINKRQDFPGLKVHTIREATK